MNHLGNVDLALLILRVAVGYVFLFAAWKNSENEAAINWTVNETSLLFQNIQLENKDRIIKVSAFVGIAIMYLGGISVVLGLESRVGGFLIAVFSVLGMRIHAIRRDEAKQAGESGNIMGWSAYSAHVAAGLKNWALIACGIFFLLLGAGSYSLDIDYVGFLLGLRL